MKYFCLFLKHLFIPFFIFLTFTACDDSSAPSGPFSCFDLSMEERALESDRCCEAGSRRLCGDENSCFTQTCPDNLTWPTDPACFLISIEELEAENQNGLCFLSNKVCTNGNLVEPDYSLIEGYQEEENLCDGQDNDCDGSTDEACEEDCRDQEVAPLSDRQEGVCEDSRKICDEESGEFVEPDYDLLEGYEIDETSCDGLDNNCNGDVDEGFELGLACELGVGACQSEGLLTCDNQGGVTCDAALIEPDTESCDGIDNDCDNETDEGTNEICYTGPVESRNVGLCQEGIMACVEGQLSKCQNQILPREEQCDGLDNDCDATIDENFDFESDPLNCGGCNRSCSELQAATAICVSGECRDSCQNTAECNHGELCSPMAYCVRIEETYLKALNAEAGDGFGISVALDNNRIAIGSLDDGDVASTQMLPNNNAERAGAVYIFEKQEDGSWRQTAYLKPNNIESRDDFGRSVALHGNFLLVGAPMEDGDAASTGVLSNNNASLAGAAYIFEKQENGDWVQRAYLKAHNAGENDRFGSFVTLGDNHAVIGAPNEQGDSSSTQILPNDNAEDAGAVYVFEKQMNGSWEQSAYLKSSNANENDGFGFSIDLDGDRLLVGAYVEDGDVMSTVENPNDNANAAGAAYVFERQEDNSWLQTAYLKAPNAEEEDLFGYSVSLHGDRLAISSLEDGDAASTLAVPNNNAERAGAVYIFDRQDDGTWAQTAYLKAQNADEDDRFGISTSLDGDRLLIGAYVEGGDALSTVEAPNNNAIRAGAAYIFEKPINENWRQVTYLKASNAGQDDFFGISVSLDGNQFVVGASTEDGDALSTQQEPNDNAVSAGAAYFFQGL